MNKKNLQTDSNQSSMERQSQLELQPQPQSEAKTGETEPAPEMELYWKKMLGSSAIRTRLLRALEIESFEARTLAESKTNAGSEEITSA